MCLAIASRPVTTAIHCSATSTPALILATQVKVLLYFIREAFALHQITIDADNSQVDSIRRITNMTNLVNRKRLPERKDPHGKERTSQAYDTIN